MPHAAAEACCRGEASALQRGAGVEWKVGVQRGLEEQGRTVALQSIDPEREVPDVDMLESDDMLAPLPIVGTTGPFPQSYTLTTTATSSVEPWA